MCLFNFKQLISSGCSPDSDAACKLGHVVLVLVHAQLLSAT